MKINLKGNTSQETSILPSEYTQVDYIESSGTQYIDTGFKVNYNTRVVIDFIVNQRSDAWLLGSRISYGDSNYAVLIYNGGEIRTDYNVGGQGMGAYANNTRYILDKNKNVSTLYQNGTQVSQITATYSEFNPNHNMYLFACNNNGSVSAMATAKIFSCKIYDNGKLIRDYIPCYRNSDNEIGLYDLVNNVFYTNAGTGAFAKGSNSTLPNPDYPQDIHVVSGDNTIKVEGKNLFNGETEVGAYNTTTGAKGPNNNTRRNVDFIDVLPNTTYTLSRNGSTFNCRYMYYDKNKAYINSEVVNGSITIPANCYYLNFYSDQLVSNYSNLQLEKGSTATTYEAYKGASYPINLGDIELCKIGDYQDSIVKDNSKWYLNKQIGKVVLDGSENWEWNSGQIGAYTHWFLNNGKAVSYSPTICDYFINSQNTTWVDNRYGFDSVGGTMWIKSTSTFNSLSTFTTWLGTNKPIVYYVLNTPTYTEITDSTLISQLETVKRSYDGQTNISQTNNDLPFIINATALKEMS